MCLLVTEAVVLGKQRSQMSSRIHLSLSLLLEYRGNVTSCLPLQLLCLLDYMALLHVRHSVTAMRKVLSTNVYFVCFVLARFLSVLLPGEQVGE